MIRKLEPIVGEWYRDYAEQRLFEVVALDEDDDRIDIQYADGDVLELDRAGWNDLRLSFAPPPETDYDSSRADNGLDSELPADDWHDDHGGLELDDY